MEQITAAGWAKEQMRRAPAFAMATCVVAALLVASTFVRYSAAGVARDELIISSVELDEPEPEPIAFLPDPDRAEPKEPPDLKPPPNLPEVKDLKVDPIKDLSWGDETKDLFDLPPGPPEPVVDPAENVALPDNARTEVIGLDDGPPRGGPGLYDGRDERGRRRAVRIGGMPPEALTAIVKGLWWLKRTQNRQTGTWDVRRWGGSKRDSGCGVSGLALLAFLGYGATDRDARFGQTVKRAVRALIDAQHTEPENCGWFGERMYSQGICTIALSEASVMLWSPRLRKEAKDAAQRGLDYILRRQPVHGAFGYTAGGNDVSVTGWQVMALKSAAMAGLSIPKGATARTHNFLKLCVSRNHGTPYRFNPHGGTTGGTPRMTAVSLTARLFMGRPRTAPDCVGQANWLVRGDREFAMARSARDYYYLYYMSMAMYQMGGTYWRRWNEAFSSPLVKRQVSEGPDRGSWPVEGSAYGRHGGRVYATAMGCLALEVYFKHLPLYKTRPRG